MKNKKNNLIAGTLIAGAIFGAGSLNASASEIFRFNELGSGSTVRANLLNQSEESFRAFLLELNCGENTKPAETKKTETKKTENKSKEAKCGEGKCGENAAKETKTEIKADTSAVKAESKSKEAKCGEGKCGVE